MSDGNKPIVKCSVSNCTFWGESNLCQADSIMIDIDQHAKLHYGSEFANEDFLSNHQDQATTSSVTCCHTFKPKS